MDITRRELLTYTAAGAGMAVAGGLIGAGLTYRVMSQPPPIILPGCPAITSPGPNRRLYSPQELSKLTVSLHPYLDSRKRWNMKMLGLMEQGLRKHGLSPTYEKANAPIDSDVAIGWTYHPRKMHQYRHAKGLHTLFMEGGFFEPSARWASIGWEGIHNCANFHHKRDDGERWEKYFSHQLSPWKHTTDGYILFLGQVDSSLDYGVNMRRWMHKTIADLSALYDKEIIFRPHPIERQRYTRKVKPLAVPGGVSFSQHRSLSEDLKGAAFCVTYNSNAATASVLAGVPCVIHHQSAIAAPVTSHDINNPYFTPDRSQWCHETAWKQWNHKEIRNGDAWDVVKQYLLA